MEQRQRPRASLARNLRLLMEREHLTQMTLAKRAKVSQKTISHLLNVERSPTLDSVEAVAHAFGLEAWHLILPNLPEELVSGGEIERLYQNYCRAQVKGRQFIDQVAEREAELSA